MEEVSDLPEVSVRGRSKRKAAKKAEEDFVKDLAESGSDYGLTNNYRVSNIQSRSRTTRKVCQVHTCIETFKFFYVNCL